MASPFEHGVDWQALRSCMSNHLSCLDLENTGRRWFGSGVHRTKEVRIGTHLAVNTQVVMSNKVDDLVALHNFLSSHLHSDHQLHILNKLC
jgi:hypothetical protein